MKVPSLMCWIQRGALDTLVAVAGLVWLGKHKSKGGVGGFRLVGFWASHIQHPLRRQLQAVVNTSTDELCFWLPRRPLLWCPKLQSAPAPAGLAGTPATLANESHCTGWKVLELRVGLGETPPLPPGSSQMFPLHLIYFCMEVT